MDKTVLLAADAATPITSESCIGDVDAPEFLQEPDEPVLATKEMKNITVPESMQLTTKECPVCHAQAFSDMETCYNCMYTFGSKPELESAPQGAQSDTEFDTCEQASYPAQPSVTTTSEDELLARFLKEFHGFLGQFLLHNDIRIKEGVGFSG